MRRHNQNKNPIRREKMTTNSTQMTRRTLLATSAAIDAISVLPTSLAAAASEPAIRPFQVHFPDAAMADLRRRL
jgi:hypothetical protein